MRRLAIALAALSLPLAAASTVLADATSDQCIDSNARAQMLRRSGKLIAAREQLRVCIDRACPAMVRDDCAKRLDELNRQQPTIVFDAEDGAGGDLVAVSVTVEGRPLTPKLDGLPLDVDPGPHAFAFEAAGRRPITRTLVLKEGEKGRLERVVFAGPPSTETAPVPPVAPAKDGEHGLGGGKIAGLVLGVAGLGGIGVGAAYGLFAKSAFDKSTAECNTGSCPGGTRDQALSNHRIGVTDATVSTIAFVAGGVLFATGLTLVIAAPSPRSSEHRDAATLRLAPTFGPETAGLDLRGEF